MACIIDFAKDRRFLKFANIYRSRNARFDTNSNPEC